jgi:hypothetical protein
MATFALRRKACRFRRSKYPADRLRPRAFPAARPVPWRKPPGPQLIVGMMDTEMPMSTAAPIIATVIIEPENLSCLTILLQPTPFNARKNRWRCLFLASSLRSKSNYYACYRWRWPGLEAIRTLLKRACLLKIVLTQDPTSAALGGMALAEIQRDRLATRSRV